MNLMEYKPTEKCEYCDTPTEIVEGALIYKGKTYALPACKKCGVAFYHDINWITRNSMN